MGKYDYLQYLLHSCPFFDLLEKYIAERNEAMQVCDSVNKFKHILIFLHIKMVTDLVNKKFLNTYLCSVEHILKIYHEL